MCLYFYFEREKKCRWHIRHVSPSISFDELFGWTPNDWYLILTCLQQRVHTKFDFHSKRILCIIRCEIASFGENWLQINECCANLFSTEDWVLSIWSISCFFSCLSAENSRYFAIHFKETNQFNWYETMHKQSDEMYKWFN